MPFNPTKYKDIGYDQLLIFSVFSLQKSGKEVTFEELVKEAFEIFPERFKLLIKDRMWPDASLINKSWLRCRTDKKWITGNRASGFSLTPMGKKVAMDIAKQLMDSKQKNIVEKPSEKTRSSRIIKQVLDSSAYKKFQKKDKRNLTEFEVCDSILCNTDSPTEIKQKHILLIKQHAEEINNRSVINFLNFINTNYPHFVNKKTNTKKLTGGMMKRK